MTRGDVAMDAFGGLGGPVVSRTGFEPAILFPVDGVQVPVLPTVADTLQR